MSAFEHGQNPFFSLQFASMTANTFKNTSSLLVLLALVCGHGRTAHAETSLGVGLGAVEEGDDRLRPSLIGELAVTRIGARLTQYGTRYSLVSQQTSLVSMFYTDAFSQAGWKFLNFEVGLWGLRETTKIKATAVSAARTEVLSSGGVLLGLSARILDAGLFYSSVNWSSHLYLPGTAFILLSTGRRQVLSLTAGVQL